MSCNIQDDCDDASDADEANDGKGTGDGSGVGKEANDNFRNEIGTSLVILYIPLVRGVGRSRRGR